MLMEMVMTNTYTFPPVTHEDHSLELLAKERQVSESAAAPVILPYNEIYKTYRNDVTEL